MRKTHQPKVVQQPLEIITEEQIRKLLATGSGKGFYERRDTAIIRLLIDTGMRRSEIVNIKLEDLDLDLNVIRVIQKGRRMKVCPFRHRTALAIDRWLRIRRTHKDADCPYLWLGHKSRMTHDDIYDLLDKRCKQAGLPHIHPHLFRHTYAHMFLEAGGQEGDLMLLGGWISREIISRYGKSGAEK